MPHELECESERCSAMIETPQKTLAAGVLSQAMQDIRRFRAARTAVERELYRDAYNWIVSHDISWPFSFLNVCRSLEIDAEYTRYQLLADASLGPFLYWIRRGGHFARALGSSVSRVFTPNRNSIAPANAWTTPPLQPQ